MCIAQPAEGVSDKGLAHDRCRETCTTSASRVLLRRRPLPSNTFNIAVFSARTSAIKFARRFAPGVPGGAAARRRCLGPELINDNEGQLRHPRLADDIATATDDLLLPAVFDCGHESDMVDEIDIQEKGDSLAG